ncbi:Cbb3-type cytochrome oxidase subunit 3 [Sphingobium quisquiliarum P25]|uniref:Cbb3-type cytochrome oxidase subunit 3 n=1 Tax=Sphingobium quisquiliarum P25 TaxID=1329909 RepID=T0IGQ4_9SPHN|nr:MULTISPECIES: CcoQ/FixQ family Cbb3-type cytochrome c oxidase assembly chaperone [Sphingobium]EQB08804.1 Cbb3-type cytochrome oxidase subunit 3 [Sphingobium quisquiliarum P25]EZP73983.1 Cbb3-type cytochrome oxidase subunit 3 [Sphingomonas paucimobilis]
MSYDALRHFADSWGLVFMAVTYAVLIGWHFLPKGRERSDKAALAIFETDETEAGNG